MFKVSWVSGLQGGKMSKKIPHIWGGGDKYLIFVPPKKKTDFMTVVKDGFDSFRYYLGTVFGLRRTPFVCHFSLEGRYMCKKSDILGQICTLIFGGGYKCFKKFFPPPPPIRQISKMVLNNLGIIWILFLALKDLLTVVSA